MVNIQFGPLANYFSKSIQFRLKFSPHLGSATQCFGISRKYNSSENVLPLNGTQPFTTLQSKLFKLNQKLTSLDSSITTGKSLPIDIEVQRLRSMAASGQCEEAIYRWKSRVLVNDEEQALWTALGIRLMCQSFRVRTAEEIASKSIADQNVCLEFIRSYAQLNQPLGLENWIRRLGNLKITADFANKVLEILVRYKMWPQAQLQIEIMSQNKIVVDPKVTAACLEADNSPPPIDGLVMLLSMDGNIINVPRFRRLLSNPLSKLSYLLSNNQIAEAVDFVNEQKCQHEIALCYKLLKYLLNDRVIADTPENNRRKWINTLANKVSTSSIRSGIYVQFTLTYLESQQDFEALVEFLHSKSLLTAHPKIQGTLTYSNYLKIWKLINVLKTSHINMDKSILMPLNIRHFTSVTLHSTALQPPLLRVMVETLNTIPDLSALTALLKYADTECNVQLNPMLLSRHGNKDSSSNISNNWQSTAQYYCKQHGTDVFSVEQCGLM